MKKKWIWALVIILLIGVLSGCSDLKHPVDANSTGIWSHYFVYPLSWFIIKVADIFGGSFGISIIISTIIVRLVLLPLMIKQTKSSKAMQDVQPQIQKLREKYSSKDQETQKKLQQETMKLFQEHGVNPLAGCLPMLIQMPILIAFYHAISRTEVIKQQSFLWFSLGQPDHYYILPILAAITTFIQQKIMVGRAGNANPQMAMMTYIFPVMIAIFAFNFPAALALYWVIGNLFMVFQTYFITLPMKKPAVETGGAKIEGKGNNRKK
ncbi:YidC family membrane integrase SpoIIIJ [Pullulanibacillus sp. KACC 23026]|uniref:YidC family membrane integrase SpoIIIJ n=1 Tax=Pullulanibacillus sp. KACC 23026 TaxID=3028315 RepID=UPI0023B10444|nr:YidC family membrane integrase SpoIIIJ [Pullulanibacillus sp. KACC 23026]WEG12785.1 YidC family membrane integrase SpoIIIJ [Pullulanibacillus sp. KACC 23026]